MKRKAEEEKGSKERQMDDKTRSRGVQDSLDFFEVVMSSVWPFVQFEDVDTKKFQGYEGKGKAHQCFSMTPLALVFMVGSAHVLKHNHEHWQCGNEGMTHTVMGMLTP